jgi:small subunit ribosomal protein S11
MGKVKIITKEEGSVDPKEVTTEAPKQGVKVPKKKIVSGTLHIEATFNNTKVVLSDKDGNTIYWTSAGSLGFKGAKKGTPFAAGKAGQVLGEKAKALGIKEVDVKVKGVGSGREPTIRAFTSTSFIPKAFAFSPRTWPAFPAANGVPFFAPLNPSDPAEVQ